MSRPGLVLAVAGTVVLAVLLAATDWETPPAGRASSLPVVPAAAGTAPAARAPGVAEPALVALPVVVARPALIPLPVVAPVPVVAPPAAQPAPVLPAPRRAPRSGLPSPAARPAAARPVPPVVVEVRLADRPAALRRVPSQVRLTVRPRAPQGVAAQQIRASVAAARRAAAPAPGPKALEALPASRPAVAPGTVSARPAVRAVAPETGRVDAGRVDAGGVDAARAGSPEHAISSVPAAAPAAFELAPAPQAAEPPGPPLVQSPDPEAPQPDPPLPQPPVSSEGKDDSRFKGRDDEDGGRDRRGKPGGDDGDDD